MMGMGKYNCRLTRGQMDSEDGLLQGTAGEKPSVLPQAAVSVSPTPSPAAGAPGSVAYEVLPAPSLEISGLCEASESEVRPSVLSHIPDPSVHKTDRRLGRPGR